MSSTFSESSTAVVSTAERVVLPAPLCHYPLFGENTPSGSHAFLPPGAATATWYVPEIPCDEDRQRCTHIPSSLEDSRDEDHSSHQVARAQTIVKAFVRSLVGGRSVIMLQVDGGTAECMLHIDRDLTALSIERTAIAAEPSATEGRTQAGSRRGIPLEDIEHIVLGADSVMEDFGLAVGPLCASIVLESCQAISFQFPDEEERDTFALCLSMFVDGYKRAQAEDEASANAMEMVFNEQG